MNTFINEEILTSIKIPHTETYVLDSVTFYTFSMHHFNTVCAAIISVC